MSGNNGNNGNSQENSVVVENSTTIEDTVSVDNTIIVDTSTDPTVIVNNNINNVKAEKVRKNRVENIQETWTPHVTFNQIITSFIFDATEITKDDTLTPEERAIEVNALIEKGQQSVTACNNKTPFPRRQVNTNRFNQIVLNLQNETSDQSFDPHKERSFHKDLSFQGDASNSECVIS